MIQMQDGIENVNDLIIFITWDIYNNPGEMFRREWGFPLHLRPRDIWVLNRRFRGLVFRQDGEHGARRPKLM